MRKRANPIIVCRCEDVTLDEVEKILEKGYRDLESIKRLLRVGMGPCQGRTCIPLLIRLLARRLKKDPEELLIPPSRPPLTPIPIRLFVEDEKRAED
ncbi:MAG: (2Fe-2S)-binding protein [Thermoprotei archaeon]|nr:MAG: (2Fe-2S)-binding protein [Thermoprotei archaeon]RLE82392.1 MAG: (2Fe-2S)-binding protein [Thermoprotei archaeon]RLF03157.1 MAG: (2Fe-2S)-binding protein [Thermoprotei archaeon]